ncbi:MAG: tetratricopeptide repeat protein [Thermoanaerobaculia bacterium]
MRRFRVLSLLCCLAAVMVFAGATPPPTIDAAVKEQQARVAGNPQDPGALNDLGNLLRLAGRTDEAATAYSKAIELDAHRAAPRYNLALLLLSQGKSKAALKQLRTVVEIDPSHAWAHYQTGAILEHQGEDGEAIEEYATAFNLDPELASSRTNPQVIENRLLTSALLRASRLESKFVQAPSAYEEPARIRSLLVPAPAPSEPPPAPADANAPAQAADKASRPAAAQKSADASGRRVLTEESLGTRQVGQVRQNVGGPGGYQRGGGGSASRAYPTPVQGGTTTGSWSWPNAAGNSGTATRRPTNPTTGAQPRVVLPGSAGQAPRVVQPGSPGQPARPGGAPPVYRPGLGSTGRAGNVVEDTPLN